MIGTVETDLEILQIQGAKSSNGGRVICMDGMHIKAFRGHVWRCFQEDETCTHVVSYSMRFTVPSNYSDG